jgi:hypothetical protein
VRVGVHCTDALGEYRVGEDASARLAVSPRVVAASGHANARHIVATLASAWFPFTSS